MFILVAFVNMDLLVCFLMKCYKLPEKSDTTLTIALKQHFSPTEYGFSVKFSIKLTCNKE